MLGNLSNLIEMLPTWILLGLAFFRQVTSQFTQPGHKYKVDVYLPAGCGEADFKGLYGVNLISQRDGTYPRDLDCILHLHIPRGFVFNITFTHFDLEPPTADGTCSDFLQLYNGFGTELQLSTPLCGNQLPSPVFSNTSVITLKFHTDGQHEHTGFSLIYDRMNAKELQNSDIQNTIQQELRAGDGRSEDLYSKPSSQQHHEQDDSRDNSWQKKGAP